jgi:hypothetical protein
MIAAIYGQVVRFTAQNSCLIVKTQTDCDSTCECARDLLIALAANEILGVQNRVWISRCGEGLYEGAACSDL